MGVKTNIALGLLATGGLVLGGGSAAFLVMQNQKAAQVTNDLEGYDTTSVAGYTPAQGEQTLVLLHQLSGGNTMLAWDAEKNKPGGAHDAFSGTWTNLTGAVVYNPAAQSLSALEVIIQANSIVGLQGTFKPAPPTLTNTLIGETPGMPAWFDLGAHPTANYTATEFLTREQAEADGEDIFDNAPEGWTHLIKGTFNLNGKEVALAIPAKAEFIGEELVLNLGFQLNRSDFGVEGTIVGGWVVDDVIKLTATVESAPKGDIIVDTLRDHDVRLAENRALIDSMGRMENQIEELNSQVAALREQLAAGVVAGGTPEPVSYDLSELPEQFTETVTYPGKQPMGFDMVRVPGDAAQGIAPFYMSEYEVTWALFYDWAYANDIGVNEQAELERQGLRPSPLYQDCDQLKIGMGNRPAISMSRRTAEAFCKWLSEQTGRNYRLPTDREWLLALELGGGIPSNTDTLLAQATMLDNAESKAAEGDPFDPFADDSAEDQAPLVFSTLVGSRTPNALGIYDMIGNAAEWVTDTGAERYVRGGHFRLPLEEYSADWKSVEDQDIWNETYPQKPNSRFWYRDHYYQGIRLVCDPVNLPE